jgi:tripartite-type tricarboxylate transporter receptor subunit TctC
MNQALSQVLSTKDIRERLITLGYYPQIMTSIQFSQFMQNESARWGALCRELKIEV